MNDYQYIKDYYKVPAEFGREVSIKGKKGFIVEDRGNYIGVNFHDEKRTRVHSYHPTDNIVYLGLGTPRKLTRGQLRYKRYVESDSSLSFIEWLKYKND